MAYEKVEQQHDDVTLDNDHCDDNSKTKIEVVENDDGKKCNKREEQNSERGEEEEFTEELILEDARYEFHIRTFDAILF